MNKPYKIILVIILSVIIFSNCKKKPDTLFQLISPEDSGITFTNNIPEDENWNILNFEYLYNGGGVGIADFNKDGLKDVFFTGNNVDNQLYLNSGDLKFENISETAGIAGKNRWKSGLAITDINQDGWPDIYVCATLSPDSTMRTNLFFIHQGLDENGKPYFIDQASEYGLDENTFSSDAAWIDYDNDGDQDLFILTNSKQKGVPTNYKPKVNDGTAPTTDKLYRNNGDGSFTDVGQEMGILHEGYSLGKAIFDINNDGWLDIYICNDFLTNDVLYLNQGGIFEDKIDDFIKHQSKFSMGVDVSDINNDGHPDITTLDMLPEYNLRKKTVVGDAGYIIYINDVRYGYTHQYARNMVQVNDGHGGFMEVGQMLGLHDTEWSWSPLWADYDNDGDRDLIVTNGFPKDIMDRDFINYRGQVGAYASDEYLIQHIPSVKVPNYVFRNDGDLNFKKVTIDWGFNQPTFSNGAAYVDLDNDGDLDYIVNNINDPAFLYRNNTIENRAIKNKNFLQIDLDGPDLNPYGFGTKITYERGGEMMNYQHTTARGYISNVDPTIHLGLGADTLINTIHITWPDGNQQSLTDVKSNQRLVINYDQANKTVSKSKREEIHLFNEIAAELGIEYTQPDYDFIDYNIQRTIPHKFTQDNPAIAVGDVNGDGLEDFVVGSYENDVPRLFIQNKDGGFAETRLTKEMSANNDSGLLLFDLEGDGDLDLYVVSGGFKFSQDYKENLYQDRIYVNDGLGNFKEEKNILPEEKESGSCARAYDFDRDGDLDLFIGGRVVPHKYPYAPQSYVLENQNGQFIDATAKWAPEIAKIGMITDAIWTDYNNDNQIDLLVIGEYMEPIFFQNNGQSLTRSSIDLSEYRGWYNTIAGADIDQDGDIDYILGNLGQNNQYEIDQNHPLKVFADDFDANGSVDAILACYQPVIDDEKKLCPIHFWDDLAKQSPRFRQQFESYYRFGMATIDSILTEEEQKNALVLEVNYVKSCILINDSQGGFSVKPLPWQAQVAPVRGIEVEDVDGDGKLDLLITGNDFGNEVFSGVFDALGGLVLLGDGQGFFEAPSETDLGFSITGDPKAFVEIQTMSGPAWMITQNKGKLKAFRRRDSKMKFLFNPEPNDARVSITFDDGRSQLIELYYGQGFLSQSSRQIKVPEKAVDLTITKMDGTTRKIKASPENI